MSSGPSYNRASEGAVHFSSRQSEIVDVAPPKEVGSIGRGHVHLRNVGSENVRLHTEQPIRAWVLSTTNENLASFNGFVVGTGLSLDLTPGDTATIPILFGTSIQNGDETTPLPPGDYLVHVDVPILELKPNHDGYVRSYLPIPDAPLRIVDSDSSNST